MNVGEPTKLEGQKPFSVKKDVLKHFKNLLRCYLKDEIGSYWKFNCIYLQNLNKEIYKDSI